MTDSNIEDRIAHLGEAVSRLEEALSRLAYGKGEGEALAEIEPPVGTLLIDQDGELWHRTLARWSYFDRALARWFDVTWDEDSVQENGLRVPTPVEVVNALQPEVNR